MISGGTIENQKQKVAEVASLIFGKRFSDNQIIQETLTRCFDYSNGLPSKNILVECVNRGVDTEGALELLMNYPTAIWLENEIALKETEGILVRNKPCRFIDIVLKFEKYTNLPQDKCIKHINAIITWIANVNVKNNDSHYTYLPFRLHQFVSQTGSVYTTLDRDDRRDITLEPSPFKIEDQKKKPLFPNVFSRTSGQSFICVRVNHDTSKLEPREFRNLSDENEENIDDGYIILGEDVWNPDEDLDQLPESWLKINKKGEISVQKAYKNRIPQEIYFDEEGNHSFEKPMKYSAWYMPAPLLFDPTSGTFFDAKTSESTKLAKLGSEGRSSSTTILSLSLLQQLAHENLCYEDQKLLSFTDNRQDAALQSGHFNDFLDTVQLRAAIYIALLKAGKNAINYKNLGDSIFNALDLDVLEYANTDIQPASWKLQKYQDTFKKYLVYRAFYDLKRGWRVNLPNLEQCALLEMDYEDIEHVSDSNELWDDLLVLNNLSKEEKQHFIYQILEYFRHSYALYSETYLVPRIIDENHKEILENLKSPWKFEQNENIPKPSYIRSTTLHPRTKLFTTSAGPNSRLGKYVRWYITQRISQSSFKSKDYIDFIEELFSKLEKAGFLKSKEAKNANGDKVYVYQLRLSSIIWKLGDKENVKPDIVKSRAYKSISIPPNKFFQELYQVDFSKIKTLRAGDHTGQLQNEDRLQREDEFRSGKLSALYCSPTMELGIDIRDLNIVHMRNAPPNPANYAQRSGRAGRSGQAALVFTFCSSYSPHDRHYFSNQSDIVAGAVSPPNIDLRNEELLKSHLNALYLSEIGLRELEDSIDSMVDSIIEAIPLSENIKLKLQINQKQRAKIVKTFKMAIKDMENCLEDVAWYNDLWIEHVIDSFIANFDNAINRWRNLFISAKQLLKNSTEKLASGLLISGSKEFRQENLNMRRATLQLELLRNSRSNNRANQISEFYPYRYFASEGFLPGYNFTRLPLRTFVCIGDGGEFISRPRTIALREFGPQNIIYHKGRKYQIVQMISQDAENQINKAKVCLSSGYFLTGDSFNNETCPLTHVSLQDNSSKEFILNLLEMSETRSEETSRISCEEEERLSRGYDISTYFAIDGDIGTVKRAALKNADEKYINMTYIPAARIFYVNHRWRSRQEEGFTVGLTSGIWYKKKALENRKSESEDVLNVKLFTSNTADALCLEPMSPLGLNRDGVITLQYALKRAIENIFQVESREIAVTVMGLSGIPNIFIYESSEGSLGVLSQFVQNPKIFNRVIEEAINVCRFEDNDYKEPASYDDLLSYYNQREHQIIDRWLIKDALEKLKICSPEIITNPNFESYEKQYNELLKRIDPNSSTELDFMNYLYRNNLQLPDDAQVEVDGLYVQPDFLYKPNIWVFCDGTPHDKPEIKEDDKKKRQAIRNRGDEVIVYYYRDKLEDLVKSRPDIFRKVR